MKFTTTIIIVILLFHVPESITFGPWRLVSFLKPKLVNFIDLAMNGAACGTDLKRLIDDVFKQKLWAIKMLDANSKLHSGLLEGNMMLNGNYDQCLSVQNQFNGRSVSGQYCTVLLIPEDNLIKLFHDLVTSTTKNKKANINLIDWKGSRNYKISHYGLCIPKSCSVANLTSLWTNFKKVFNFPIEAKFLEESCYHQNKQIPSNTIDVYVFCFFVFIVILELVSTGYDIHLRNSGQEPNLFVSFSLYTNSKKLLSMNCQNKTLTCLYGIKMISIIWVLFGHIVILKMYNSINTYHAISEWTIRLENSVFLAASYAVDTFFSVSGLLVIYVGLSYSKKTEIYFWMVYLHRVIRLVPALLATILFYISIVKYLLEGPFAFRVLKELKTNCEQNWWTTLFFVNNFHNFQERCVAHSWYLSIDTQLYLLSPLLIYGAKINPRKTFLGVIIACAISFIYTWTVVVANKIGFILYWEVSDNVVGYTYFSTLSRMPVWFIGTWFGYLIYQHDCKEVKISKITNLILWAISLSIMISLILSHVIFFREEFNLYRSAFFNTFSRPLWSLSVCFIIFSCCTGHGGLVNVFLSHPIFVVLGKLTYSIYLTHVMVLYAVGTNRKQSGYFNTFEILFEFCGYFVFTLISATVLCLVFEAPVLSFLNHLEARKWKKKQ